MGLKEPLTVGRIIRPHGLKGEVEVTPLTDFPDRFAVGVRLYLRPPLPEQHTLTIRRVLSKKDLLVIGFSEVDDRGSAAGLSGRELVIPEAQGVKPAGAFWQHEIIGCRVMTDSGREIGLVTEIIRTAGHDIYVVDGEKQFLIPAVGDVIKKIDIEGRLIEIAPTPGLLEL